MEKFLNAVGLHTVNEEETSAFFVYRINNPDGSPRWIWNATATRPLFLGFYAAASLKARMFSRAVKLVFAFRLQHRLFASSRLKVVRDSQHPLCGYMMGDFALFTGTEGPNRKLVLFAGIPGSEKQFIKVAVSNASQQLIQQEYEHLNWFGQGKYYRTPQATLVAPGILALEDMRRKGSRSSVFTPLHARVCAEFMKTGDWTQFSVENSPALESFRNLTSAVSRIPENLVVKLNKLARQLGPEMLLHAPAHADFTPWNCFITGSEELSVYDFELAGPHFPLGFDAFHFVMQQSIFVEHRSWKEMKPLMIDAFNLLCNTCGCTTGTTDAPAISYLKAYLLVNISYYLQLYARQDNWHTQVYWQFATWNDALSDLISTVMDPRTLLIDDLFALLNYKPYAALKFPDCEPSQLSEFADIDLLLHKPAAMEAVNYLKRHSLVEHVELTAFSHMISMQLVLNDARILAIDFIWKLKRRALQFMDTDKVLGNAVANQYGVKQMSVADTQVYLSRFYGLNGSQVPGRYHSFFSEGYKLLNFSNLQQEVSREPSNKAFSGIKNTLQYMKDTLSTRFRKKGIVITFSGVDGAGKSTILEQTRYQIEKKLRRNVVVIRHRPSLLPILSAYTYGKEQAEKRAASTLPRQGNNKSTLSSLLRFAYYYSDYLIGQFYIWTRYTLRGTVVLYDRYYFDFINDSVRSNIRLPKWIMKAGYALLMQPHLNFFLYADAATILERKKELDAETITRLTREYLELFGELSRRGSDRYFPIENIILEDTVSFIIEKVQKKLLR